MTPGILRSYSQLFHKGHLYKMESSSEQENNCFRLQYNSVVIYELFFWMEQNDDWFNFNLYCMYSTDKKELSIKRLK